MTNAIEIGDTITFRDRGATRQGRVVGAETVSGRDYRGRRPGRWFVVRCELFEQLEVHADEIGAIVGVSAAA